MTPASRAPGDPSADAVAWAWVVNEDRGEGEGSARALGDRSDGAWSEGLRGPAGRLGRARPPRGRPPRPATVAPARCHTKIPPHALRDGRWRHTVPTAAGHTPTISRARVDLPEALGPITPTTSPGSIAKERPCRTGTRAPGGAARASQAPRPLAPVPGVRVDSTVTLRLNPSSRW